MSPSPRYQLRRFCKRPGPRVCAAPASDPAAPSPQTVAVSTRDSGAHGGSGASWPHPGSAVCPRVVRGRAQPAAARFPAPRTPCAASAPAAGVCAGRPPVASPGSARGAPGPLRGLSPSGLVGRTKLLDLNNQISECKTHSVRESSLRAAGSLRPLATGPRARHAAPLSPNPPRVPPLPSSPPLPPASRKPKTAPDWVDPLRRGRGCSCPIQCLCLVQPGKLRLREVKPDSFMAQCRAGCRPRHTDGEVEAWGAFGSAQSWTRTGGGIRGQVARTGQGDR